jgi:hypothetical protein
LGEPNRDARRGIQNPGFFMPTTVLPVSAAAAFLWARGKLNDRELILSAPLVPEAIFVIDLPDLSSWRDCLAQCAALHAAGAVMLIMRTGTPTVAHYALKRGILMTLTEHTTPVKSRYLLPPAALTAWLAPFVTHQAPPRIISAESPKKDLLAPGWQSPGND